MILADKLLAKEWRSFETFESVNDNNSCGKLISCFVLLIILDDNLKVIPVLFNVGEFNLLSNELDNCICILILSYFFHENMSNQNRFLKDIQKTILRNQK